MSVSEDEVSLSESWQTRFFTDAISMSEPQRGICEIGSGGISLRAGGQSQHINVGDITDITVGSPPNKFTDEFDEVFGIRFTTSGTSRLCLIRHDADRVDIFEYKLFAKITNGAKGVAELGAMRGGQQTDTTSQQIIVKVTPDQVVFRPKSGTNKRVALGDIVNIQTGTRTVGGGKRDAIKLDHMSGTTRVTSYVSLINSRQQHLLNRYMRKEYAQLREKISDTEVSKSETELVVGFYTTQDLQQTMQTLTGGDEYKFESIFEKAIEHGLVTHPENGVNLTQKGKMLANTELESVNT